LYFCNSKTKFEEIKSVEVLEFKVETNVDSDSWVNFGSGRGTQTTTIELLNSTDCSNNARMLGIRGTKEPITYTTSAGLHEGSL
jgi:hypothetical protein